MGVEKKEIEGFSSYQIEAWIMRLGSFPKEVIKSVDISECYEMTAAHVFKLENKKYALVTESGCSCYSASDANIDLFPTKDKALTAFAAWEKQHKRREF